MWIFEESLKVLGFPVATATCAIFSVQGTLLIVLLPFHRIPVLSHIFIYVLYIFFFSSFTKPVMPCSNLENFIYIFYYIFPEKLFERNSKIDRVMWQTF